MKVWGGEITITQSKIAGREIWFASSDPDDTIQRRHINAGDFYELEELLIIKRNIPNDAHILEVGANIGNHTIYFEKFCAANCIYVIEPNPNAIRLLLLNLRLNNLSTVVTDYLGIGLSDGFSRCRIDQPDHNLGGARLLEVGSGDLVEVVPGDFEFAGKRVDFIKVDVEGMEIAALNGLKKVIENNKPDMFIEVNDSNVGQFQEWLKNENYVVVERYRRYKSNENFYVRSEGGLIR